MACVLSLQANEPISPSTIRYCDREIETAILIATSKDLTEITNSNKFLTKGTDVQE
jgi:hypothetical protein